jgi:hypothetical protein
MDLKLFLYHIAEIKNRSLILNVSLSFYLYGKNISLLINQFWGKSGKLCPPKRVTKPSFWKFIKIPIVIKKKALE